MQKSKIHTYAFDFDGVIAQYKGFVSLTHTGKPIKEVVRAMRKLKKLGHRIIIYSTRSTQLLERYCKKYRILFDYINQNPLRKNGNSGKPVAFLYIEDRTICYRGQNAETLVKQALKFKAYWEK